jgi:hypothetical protein
MTWQSTEHIPDGVFVNQDWVRLGKVCRDMMEPSQAAQGCLSSVDPH